MCVGFLKELYLFIMLMLNVLTLLKIYRDVLLLVNTKVYVANLL